MTPQNTDTPADEHPPVLNTWRNLYAFVLVLHLVLITLFYLFSQAYA